MKIILLGGFLGSGKTSVLMKIAQYITKHNTTDKKIPLVIIENEIGEISVDSKILGDYKVKELFSGCICCSLAGDLTISINQIREDFDPEYIIVEATGLALPDKIAETILQYTKDCEYLKIITIADASRFDEITESVDIFFNNQMKCGNIMLLNKTDLVDANKKNQIITKLSSINPNAELYAICANQNIDCVLEKILQ